MELTTLRNSGPGAKTGSSKKKFHSKHRPRGKSEDLSDDVKLLKGLSIVEPGVNKEAAKQSDHEIASVSFSVHGFGRTAENDDMTIKKSFETDMEKEAHAPFEEVRPNKRRRRRRRPKSAQKEDSRSICCLHLESDKEQGILSNEVTVSAPGVKTEPSVELKDNHNIVAIAKSKAFQSSGKSNPKIYKEVYGTKEKIVVVDSNFKATTPLKNILTSGANTRPLKEEVITRQVRRAGYPKKEVLLGPRPESFINTPQSPEKFPDDKPGLKTRETRNKKPNSRQLTPTQSGIKSALAIGYSGGRHYDLKPLCPVISGTEATKGSDFPRDATERVQGCASYESRLVKEAGSHFKLDLNTNLLKPTPSTPTFALSSTLHSSLLQAHFVPQLALYEQTESKSSTFPLQFCSCITQDVHYRPSISWPPFTTCKKSILTPRRRFHDHYSTCDILDLSSLRITPPGEILNTRQRSFSMPNQAIFPGTKMMGTGTEKGNTQDEKLDMLAKYAQGIDALRRKYSPAVSVTILPSTDRMSFNQSSSTDTKFPPYKPRLSSNNTSTSSAGIVKPAYTVVAPNATWELSTTVHEIETPDQIMSKGFPAHLIGKKDETVVKNTKLTSEKLTSRIVKTLALGENVAARNKTIQPRISQEKAVYLPPHLRVFDKAVGPLTKTSDICNGKLSEAKEKHIHAAANYQKPPIPLPTLSKLSRPCKEGQIEEAHRQEMATPQKILLSHHGKPANLGDIPEHMMKSPEETFSPDSVATETPPKLQIVPVEAFLPPGLRNLPKPVMLGPQVERNKKLVVWNTNHDDQTLIAQTLKQNDKFYKPVVELPAQNHLVHQLAAGEALPDLEIADDCSTVTGRGLSVNHPTNLVAPKAGLDCEWRWFLDVCEPSECGKTDFIPKEELHHQLVDWDGQWQPVPIDWDLRVQFNNRSRKHVAFMNDWITDRVMEALKSPFKVDTSSASWISGVSPASGMRKQWQTYPEDYITKRVPLNYGPVIWSDIPTLAPNDPYSHTEERLKQTSLSSAKTFCKQHYAEKKRRMEDRFAHKVEIERFKQYKAERKLELAPKANIYVRPAQLRDIAQIATIYNHYVMKTVHVPERVETEMSEWQDRLRVADEEKLAFMVAVSKSSKGPGRQRKDNPRGGRRGQGGFGPRHNNVDLSSSLRQEIIVGFAYAEDYMGRKTMYEHTVELQVFVDPKHYRNGIGLTLMDRMMPSLDKFYMSFEGTDFVEDGGNMCYQEGGSREVHKIMMSIAFAYGQESEFQWRKKWLEQVWEFDHIGTMSCIGKKFDRGVNIAQMVRETSQTNASSMWYKEQPYRISHREQAARAKALEEQLAIANGSTGNADS